MSSWPFGVVLLKMNSVSSAHQAGSVSSADEACSSLQQVQHISGWWWVVVGHYPALVLEGIQRALMADLSATGFFARSGLQRLADY